MFMGCRAPSAPVDMWQPEAITFLSIYLNPLFLAGLILMLWSVYYLTLAERFGKLRYAVYAGLCLLILGNVTLIECDHHVACIWAVYLLVRG